MKKLVLVALLFVAGCAADPVYQAHDEEGTSCITQADTNKVVCSPIREFMDPTRFHRVPPWQQYGTMPDLP